MPSVAEKGKLDIRMEVSAPGGHSSIPPKHTVSVSQPLHLSISRPHVLLRSNSDDRTTSTPDHGIGSQSSSHSNSSRQDILSDVRVSC